MEYTTQELETIRTILFQTLANESDKNKMAALSALCQKTDKILRPMGV